MDKRMANAFNLKTNLAYLIRRPPGNIEFLDGLRALSCFWIVGFHVVWFTGFFWGPENFIRLYSHDALRIVNVASYSIGIFFVLSGFLIGYLLLLEIEKHGSIAFKRFYVRRLWRLWPAYLVVLVIYCLTLAINCQNAWANILYINNFLPSEDQCMGWGWSLAIEEQFYLLCPLFLVLLCRIKQPTLQLACLAGLLILAPVIRAVIVLSADAGQGASVHPEINKGFYQWHFDTLYDKPWTRYGELLLGVVIAFVYSRKTLWHKLESSTLAKALLLVLAVTGIGMIFGETHHTIFLDNSLGRFLAIGGQLVFALGITAMMVLGLMQHSMNWLFFRVLKWKIWYPFAQLSYSLYLTHPIIIAIYYFKMEKTYGDSISVTDIYLVYPIALVLSLLLSAMIFLLVERPCLTIRARLSQ